MVLEKLQIQIANLPLVVVGFDETLSKRHSFEIRETISGQDDSKAGVDEMLKGMSAGGYGCGWTAVHTCNPSCAKDGETVFLKTFMTYPN